MRLIFTWILVISSFLVFGQNDNYIVNENGLWSTVEVHCLPTGNNYSTYFIKFTGDTTVNDLTYKKALITENELQNEWDFYGFIREDDDHQVFLKPPGIPEGKIYDFGVSVGDTVVCRNIYLDPDTLHFIVEQVDSVMMLDHYRKRITLFEYTNIKEEVWIEGIGSLYGIMNSCNNAYGGACGGYEALCYEEGGELVYQNSNYGTCYYAVTVDTPEIPESNISIYPNPATGIVIIDLGNKFSSDQNFEMEILTVNGEKILQKNLANSKNVIYLQHIKRGLYVLYIKNREDSFPRYKLIVD